MVFNLNFLEDCISVYRGRDEKIKQKLAEKQSFFYRDESKHIVHFACLIYRTSSPRNTRKDFLIEISITSVYHCIDTLI